MMFLNHENLFMKSTLSQKKAMSRNKTTAYREIGRNFGD